MLKIRFCYYFFLSLTPDPYASIVGILNPLKSQAFLNLLQVFLGSKESLYSYGRPEMFLLVPVKNYRVSCVYISHPFVQIL